MTLHQTIILPSHICQCMYFLLYTINIWKSFRLLFSSWCNFLSWFFLSWSFLSCCNFENALFHFLSLSLMILCCGLWFYELKDRHRFIPGLLAPYYLSYILFVHNKDLGTNKYEIKPPNSIVTNHLKYSLLAYSVRNLLCLWRVFE